MTASGESVPPTSGMLPGHPMAKCSECGHWSYLAAIDGRCLGCLMGTRSSFGLDDSGGDAQ